MKREEHRMINQKHLDMLKQGVEVWNQWKRDYLDEMVSDSKVYLLSADLSGMNLEGVYLEEVDLQQANLSEANLKGADLSVSSLILANLSGADLRGAVLEGTEFGGANLRNANLSGANLSTATLVGADLSDANLRNTDLSKADLRGVYLNGADLSEAEMGNTIFGDVDLSVVKGLETVKHSGPSTIGIDVIYRSHGQIPEVFLQGAGVPDTFIVYARSLAGKPLGYYTCFISYSSKDEACVIAVLLRLAKQRSALLVCARRPENRRQDAASHRRVYSSARQAAPCALAALGCQSVGRAGGRNGPCQRTRRKTHRPFSNPPGQCCHGD